MKNLLKITNQIYIKRCDSLNVLPSVIIFFLFSIFGFTTTYSQTTKLNLERSNEKVENNHIPTVKNLKDFLFQAQPNLSNLNGINLGNYSMSSYSSNESVIRNSGSRNENKTCNFDITELTDKSINGTITWISKNFGLAENFISKEKRSSTQSMRNNSIEASYGLMESIKNELKIENPREEFRPVTVEMDALGFTHSKFEQIYKGLPVFGREIYTHINNKGEIYAVNGRYEPSNHDELPTSKITSDESKDIVTNYLKKEGSYQSFTNIDGSNDSPMIKLGLLSNGNCTMTQVYIVEIHANMVEHITFFVNSVNGKIEKELHHECIIDYHNKVNTNVIQEKSNEKSKLNELSSLSFSDASGTDLNNKQRSFRTRNNNGFYEMIWDLSNYDGTKFQGSGFNNPQGAGGSAVYEVRNDSKIYMEVSSNNQWSDKSAVSAIANSELTYKYYKDVHSRKSIDNKNGTIISVIHVPNSDGTSMGNAFWNGKYISYGDGNSRFSPLAGALDVAGHEMTHGVVENTANLVYELEPGALNESFADIFGIMIDRSNFLLGEDVVRPAIGIALRDIANPENPNVASPQPAHYSNFKKLPNDKENDHGGVHVNSGIPNKAAYLTIQAIGREKVEKIWYRAISNYMTMNSQFIDARRACEQASADLFGKDGAENKAVSKSFADVGIGEGVSDGGNKKVPPQNGGVSMIAFMAQDGHIGIYNENANPKIGLINNNGAFGRTSISSTWTQLTTPRSGVKIWFINPNGVLSSIDVAKMEVLIYPSVFISNPGDLWNVSISPDGNYLAFVSKYNQDPNLYLFDGTKLVKVAINVTTSSQDFSTNLNYLDVVSWSPDMNNPKISFDGLNVYNYDGLESSFWAIYELNLISMSSFNLVANQDPSYTLGNITYSNTASRVIALNSIYSNEYETYLTDLSKSNSVFPLNIKMFTIDGVSIVDGQRPTFAPDDSKLCLSSPLNNALLLFDFSSQKLSYIKAQGVMQNPRWFLFGGKSGVDDENNNSNISFVNANYYNGKIKLDYSISKSSNIEIKISNSIGEVVYLTKNSQTEVGNNKLLIDAGNFSSGVYFLELNSNDQRKAIKLTIKK